MNQKEIKRIASAPERIWLQVGDDVKDERDMAEVDWHEASWCRERIFDTDIEYVRVDRCKGAKKTAEGIEHLDDEHRHGPSKEFY